MIKVEDILAQIGELLKSALSPKQQITKSVDVEERRALFVAMEPEVEDAHGDITSAEEIEKACNNFNKHCMKANLFHRVETDAVEIQQSFITPTDIQFENGREIKKGSWLMWMKFPEGNETSNTLWDMVKDGTVNGVSIGALGYKEEVTE